MDVQFASFNRRFLAVMADAFPLTILSYLISAALGLVYPPTDLTSIYLTFGVSFTINILVDAFYYIFSWTKFDGATIGKKLAGIKVVKVDGSPMTVGSSILRIIGYWISALGMGLGYLSVFWNKNRQGWHDKIAKTYVVQTGARPKMKLLWAFILAFAILSASKDALVRFNKSNLSFVSRDGSPVDHVTPDSVLATLLYDGSGSLKKEEYAAVNFELFKKANLIIEYEINAESYAAICVVKVDDFMKCEKGEEECTCLYEVLESPAMTTLEKGKYVFVIYSDTDGTNFSARLKATEISN